MTSISLDLDFNMIFDIMFSSMLNLKSLGIDCMHLIWSKAREQSNMRFLICTSTWNVLGTSRSLVSTYNP